jgi:hypothetical protein
MHSRRLSILSIVAVFVGIAVSSAFDARYGIHAQTRRMMPPFTALPPLGTPVNVADLTAHEISGSVTSKVMVAGMGQICELGTNGAATSGFFPYTEAYRGLINVAFGPSGEGSDPDLMFVAPGAASSFPFKGFSLSAQPPSLLGAISDIPGLAEYGLELAMGDLNGDGSNDVVLGTATGGNGEVHLLQLNSDITRTFRPFDNYSGGLRFAIGNVTRSRGRELMITQAAGGDMRLYKFNELMEHTELGRGYGFGPSYTGGIWPALGDLNNDCMADVVMGAGTGMSHIRMFNVRGESVTVLGDLRAFDSMSGGVRVATGKDAGRPYVLAVSRMNIRKFQSVPVTGQWGFDEGWASTPFGGIGSILFGVSTFTPSEDRGDER